MLIIIMKNQYLNLIYGMKNKKGMIFTLDSLVAVSIFLIVIATSSYYSSQSNSEISKLQISRTGSDISTLLENSGGLDSLDSALIENNISHVLPQNYQINLNITCQDKSLSTYNSWIVGDEIPEKEFVASGRRFFVITYNNSADFCMTQYK